MHPVPVRICIACVAVLACIGALQNLSGVYASRGKIDAVSVNEQRFRALKAALPANGQVDYIGDLDPASDAGNTARVMAQYSLAPLVLFPPLPFPRQLLDPALRNEDRFRLRAYIIAGAADWFIGDFHDASRGPAMASRAGLIVVRDFGAGVMLLRRAPGSVPR